MSNPFDLARFVDEQNSIYEDVLSELRRGRKESHWMWFIFPQIKGLGSSAKSVKFAISGKDEAIAYLHHPPLRARLEECTNLVLKANVRSIEDIFSWPDNLKFQSSMTLFDFVAPNTLFRQALKIFFRGRVDQATLAKLGQ